MFEQKSDVITNNWQNKQLFHSFQGIMLHLIKALIEKKYLSPRLFMEFHPLYNNM